MSSKFRIGWVSTPPLLASLLTLVMSSLAYAVPELNCPESHILKFSYEKHSYEVRKFGSTIELHRDGEKAGSGRCSKFGCSGTECEFQLFDSRFATLKANSRSLNYQVRDQGQYTIAGQTAWAKAADDAKVQRKARNAAAKELRKRLVQNPPPKANPRPTVPTDPIERRKFFQKQNEQRLRQHRIKDAPELEKLVALLPEKPVFTTTFRSGRCAATAKEVRCSGWIAYGDKFTVNLDPKKPSRATKVTELTSAQADVCYRDRRKQYCVGDVSHWYGRDVNVNPRWEEIFKPVPAKPLPPTPKARLEHARKAAYIKPRKGFDFRLSPRGKKAPSPASFTGESLLIGVKDTKFIDNDVWIQIERIGEDPAGNPGLPASMSGYWLVYDPADFVPDFPW
jgi:hypothetical protein